MVDGWATVSEREALAAAGAGARVVSGDSVTYAIGPAATVVIVDAGDRPDGTAQACLRLAERRMQQSPHS
jgi:hypothetical protein